MSITITNIYFSSSVGATAATPPSSLNNTTAKVATATNVTINNEPTILANKGVALYKLGKYNESLVYLDKALSINPNDFHALIYKGQALDNLGNHTQAVALYNRTIVLADKAQAINPKFVNALIDKGIALDIYYDKAILRQLSIMTKLWP